MSISRVDKTIFKGTSTALITPFDMQGVVNYKKLYTLIQQQLDEGVNALVVCGTTGESATLAKDEKRQIIEKSVEYVAGRIPIIAGSGTNNTEESIELSIMSEQAGASGLLVVTPYYNKASQLGLFKHFEAISKSVDLPIIVYDVPSRTGMSIGIECYDKLTGLKNVVGIKEASGDMSKVCKLIVRYRERFDIYSGNDDLIVPTMVMGGKGVISVISNLFPKEVVELTDWCLNDDYDQAARRQLEFHKLIECIFKEVNPIGIKQAMNIVGKEVGGCRGPLFGAHENTIKDLIAIMDEYVD